MLMTSTCRGWIAIFPRKPTARAGWRARPPLWSHFCRKAAGVICMANPKFFRGEDIEVDVAVMGPCTTR